MALIGLIKVHTDEVIHTHSGDTLTLDSIINSGMYTVASFAAAKLSRTTGQVLYTLGYSTAGYGSALYLKDGTTGAASTGTELKFYDALGVGWKYYPMGGEYDVAAFGLVGDSTADAPANVDKLQAMVDLTGRADFISGRRYSFNKFYDNSPNTDKCAIIFTRKTEIYSRNNSELCLIGSQTQDTIQKSLFGAKYDGTANGSILKCKVFIDGLGLMAIFRYVNNLLIKDVYLHGGNLPPTVTPTGASATVVLWGCKNWVIDGCKMYAAPDTTDFTTPAIQNVGFAIRALSSWTSTAVQNCTDGEIRNCEFYGHIYNATEIAGPTTLRINVHDNRYVDCCLTPLDFDKGCSDCHGYNNTIIRPKKGLGFPEAGGEQWAPMRLQGFADGVSIDIRGFGCSLRDNIIIDGGGTNDTGVNTMIYCLVDRQDSAVIDGNRQRNSLALRGLWIQNSLNTTFSNNKVFAIDFMNYTSTGTDNLTIRGNDVDVTGFVLNSGTTGNGFASMRRMLWTDNNFRYVGSGQGTGTASDGMQFRVNTSICSAVVKDNQFSYFNRPFVTNTGANNLVTFKGNIGVNNAATPVIADSTTQNVEYTSVTGY